MRTRRVAFTFVATILVIGCGSGPTGPRGDALQAVAPEIASLPAPVRPRWPDRTELERLNNQGSEEEVKELDAFVLFATSDGAADREKRLAATVLLIKSYLHQLFYVVNFDKTLHPADDPDFYQTLTTFERRAGLMVDGKFTVREFERLQFLASVVTQPTIKTGSKLVYVDREFGHAEGTWVLQGDNIAFPINRGHIECFKFNQTCTEFNAQLSLPASETDSSDPMLMTDVQHYDVIEWTTDEIRAVAKTACRQNVLTINGETKQVHQISTDLTKDGCPFLGPQQRPRLATLEDFTAIDAYLASRRERLKGIANNPFERARELYTEAR